MDISKMPDIMTPEEAAPYLGMSAQGIREHMKRGVLNLGLCIKPEGRRGHYQYRVYKAKLLKIIGEEVES